ncbi:MAG: methyltransferase domain-containing protein [Bacteroidetes bacterium]|nr:methyltransferase domain-containing protein [Bacteroidota bacterium]
MADTVQESNVSNAFSRQSVIFDAIDDANSIIIWMRERVRNEVLQFIKPGSEMLELNCGTGIDSVFFSQKGINVLATDNADGMLQQLNAKIATHNIKNLQTLKCSFNHLENITGRQFDYVFSNFGGLNCTDKLDEVLSQIDRLLKPGGYFTLVIMPVVCPWEIITVFKGYFKTAFRRFKKDGAKAHVEGVHFQCYYYNPSYIIDRMKNDFSLTSLKGLSIVVPPPFIEHFRERHGKLFTRLEKVENSIWGKAPFNRWADHFMITMQKKLV